MGLKKCPYCNEEIQEEAIICRYCKSNLVDGGNVNEKNEGKLTSKYVDRRTKEFVLGLLGGIFGIISGFISLFIGGLGSAFGASGADQISTLGIAAIVFSIIGIIGATIAKKRGKMSGIMMTVAAVGGIISISAFYIIPGILLLIPGIMGLKKPDQSNKRFKWIIWGPIGIAVIAIVFLGAKALNSSSGSNGTISKPLSTKAFKIGEEVTAGNLSYMVKSVSKAKKLKDDFSEQTAQGEFLILEVQVKNNDKESRTIDSSLFKLIEDDGTAYDPDSSADMYVNNNSEFFLNSLNPKLSLIGNVVFDVPDITKKYYLQISGGMLSSETKNISLDVPIKEMATSVNKPSEDNKAVSTSPTDTSKTDATKTVTTDTQKKLTLEEVTSILKGKYPDTNINYNSEFDYTTDEKNYYCFDLVTGTSPAFTVYVDDTTGKLYTNVSNSEDYNLQEIK